MKKSLTIIFTILSAVLILDSMNAGYAIAMFLLAGIVPGTNIVVSADQMLVLFVMLFGFVLGRVGVRLATTALAYRAGKANRSPNQA